MTMDENRQGADANLDNQDEQDADANPEQIEEYLKELSPAELLEYAKKQASDFKEYRRNSNKGVQELNKKLKEKTDDESIEERARAIAKEELDKRYITNTLNAVRNQLNDEQIEAFDEEYKFLTEWRSIDSDSVDTYVRKALDYVGGKRPTNVVWMNVGWAVKKESSSKAKAEQRKESAKAFVREMWL